MQKRVVFHCQIIEPAFPLKGFRFCVFKNPVIHWIYALLQTDTANFTIRWTLCIDKALYVFVCLYRCAQSPPPYRVYLFPVQYPALTKVFKATARRRLCREAIFVLLLESALDGCRMATWQKVKLNLVNTRTGLYFYLKLRASVWEW